LSMPWSRPMPSIGARCHELRIPDDNVTWRIIYRIDDDAILILDVFRKKTQQTPKTVIATCKRRIRAYDDCYTKEFITMDKRKENMLEAAGWKVSSAEDFLELSQVESDFIALKIALSEHLKTRRQSLRLTQKEFAGMIHSSQSRVAKMEAGDPEVTLDLLVKSLLTLKTPKEDIEKMLP